jgi:serine/threonine protein kinase
LPFEGKNIHQIFESIRSASSTIKLPNFIDKNLAKVLMGMLDKNPISRWNLKQIRDSEWFKKKHPIIKEDLARLPTDVIQNECGSTFRMINFLEKYCESLNESHNNTQATTVQVNRSNYDNSEQENFQELNSLNPSNRFISNQYTEPSQETNSLKNNNNNSTKAQNGTTLSSHQSSTMYSQAAKMKKNHCALM